jgi:hypothetical protein
VRQATEAARAGDIVADMPAKASLYLPYPDVDLRQVFPQATLSRDRFGEGWQVGIDGERVAFYRMPSEELARHLADLLRWVDRLDDDAGRKADARTVLGHTKTALGMVASSEFEDKHVLWESLFRVADAFDGYVFAHDSVLLPSGAVLVGALRRT